MTTSRRSFLQLVAASAGAAALPGCESIRSRRARKPGAKMRLMVIGVGGRGGSNLNGVAGEDVVVLCDVDRKQLAAAAKKFPNAQTTVDYRTVLRDSKACADLDGVVIGTPDHTHYLPAMLALQQGLDVYCEKPLTHTIAQARRLTEAAVQSGCVTQMGIQIHANENYRRVVEAIRGGAVGKVREVVVFVNGTDWSAQQLPAVKPAPEDLEYDLWLGPATAQPYRGDFHPAGWRRYWEFGGGTTADMGCHFVDLAFWALNLDAPKTVTADGSPVLGHCAPAGLHCIYEFPKRGDRAPLTMRWHGGKDRPLEYLKERGLEKWTNGVLFVGDENWLISDYNKHELGPTERSWQRPEPSIAKSPGHYKEWLDCCREGTQPTCSFRYGGPLTETVLLANAAYRARPGVTLQWDSKNLRFDDAAANALLDEPSRDGFTA